MGPPIMSRASTEWTGTSSSAGLSMVSVSLVVRWEASGVTFAHPSGFGLWYVAEAAMILSYAEENRRGKQVTLPYHPADRPDISACGLHLETVDNFWLGVLRLRESESCRIVDGFWLITTAYKMHPPVQSLLLPTSSSLR